MNRRSPIERVHMKINGHLDELRESFVEGVKLTFIARLPSNDEADLVVTDDELPEIAKVIHRRSDTPNPESEGAEEWPVLLPRQIADATKEKAGGALSDATSSALCKQIRYYGRYRAAQARQEERQKRRDQLEKAVELLNHLADQHEFNDKELEAHEEITQALMELRLDPQL